MINISAKHLKQELTIYVSQVMYPKLHTKLIPTTTRHPAAAKINEYIWSTKYTLSISTLEGGIEQSMDTK